MSWRLHIYPVFPRCAHDPLSACTPDQPANKLRNTGLKDTTCCCVALVVACGSAGFLGAGPPVAPGCAMGGPAASAVRAASFDRRVGSLSCQALPPRAPQPACTAAQPSDLSGTAARPCGPSGALRAGGAFAADVARRVALIPSYGCQPPIPHVIPRRLIQTLNLHRWNCNVFGTSRKMTAMNYVRNLAGGGVVAARFGQSLRSLRPPSCRWHRGFTALGAGCRRVAGVSRF